MQQVTEVETPPFGTRMRFAAGFRVPAEHREWALQQIESEGWPIRSSLQRMLVVYPFVLLVAIVTRGLLGGPWYAVGYQALIFPIVWTLSGLIIGSAWPEAVRRRARQFHTKSGRS